MKIYGDSISGNCLKVKWTADYLGLAYDWIETDILKGESRTPAYLQMNPAGQVPTVVLDDGRPLGQSNAIILHLAEGSDLIPADAYARARMYEWMFWEQYSHEPYIAVRRYQLHYLARSPEDLDPKLAERGADALRLMERTLARSAFMAGGTLTLADVALVAYTRMAHEGGFDLADYPAIRAWVGRVEGGLGIGPYAGPA